jgi:hypothetical protein
MHDKQLEKAILTYWPQVRFRVRKSLGYSNPDWEDVSNEVFIGVLDALRKKKFREESNSFHRRFGRFAKKEIQRREQHRNVYLFHHNL